MATFDIYLQYQLKKTDMNTNGKTLKEQYLEYIFLGGYYRWSAQHGPHIGSRSPIDGRQINAFTATPGDKKAHYNSCLAMARAYFIEAKHLRNEINKIYKNIH